MFSYRCALAAAQCHATVTTQLLQRSLKAEHANVQFDIQDGSENLFFLIQSRRHACALALLTHVEELRAKEDEWVHKQGEKRSCGTWESVENRVTATDIFLYFDVNWHGK